MYCPRGVRAPPGDPTRAWANSVPSLSLLLPSCQVAKLPSCQVAKLVLVLFLLLLPSLLLLANPPRTAQIDATAGLGGPCRAGRRGVAFPPGGAARGRGGGSSGGAMCAAARAGRGAWKINTSNIK